MAKSVLKALKNVISIFEIPKVIQSFIVLILGLIGRRDFRGDS